MNNPYSHTILLNYVGFFALEKNICVKVGSTGPLNIYKHLSELFYEANVRTIWYHLLFDAP